MVEFSDVLVASGLYLCRLVLSKERKSVYFRRFRGWAMSAKLQLAHDQLPIYQGTERRRKPRIYEPFWATARGLDVRDKTFESNTQLDNLSAGGLYMKLAQSVEPGTKLCVIIQFSTPAAGKVDAPRVAIDGVVRRVELNQSKAHGVALEFTHYRLL